MINEKRLEASNCTMIDVLSGWVEVNHEERDTGQSSSEYEFIAGHFDSILVALQ
jgi:hypothetical protein